jgi:hypothetical protein
MYLGVQPAFTVPSIPGFPLAVADGGTGVSTIVGSRIIFGIPFNEIVTTAGLFTVTGAHIGKLIDCTGTGGYTITLNTMANATVAIRNSSTGNISIDPIGANLIDGNPTLTLLPTESCICVSTSTGDAWKTVGKSTASLPPGLRLLSEFSRTTSGAWSATTPVGAYQARVTIVGGSGRGGNYWTDGTDWYPGSPGGQGGTSIKLVAVTPGSILSGTVGAGGAAVGGAGGQTTCTQSSQIANGGAGGAAGVAGAGGTASGGDTNITGMTGGGGSGATGWGISPPPAPGGSVLVVYST